MFVIGNKYKIILNEDSESDYAELRRHMRKFHDLCLQLCRWQLECFTSLREFYNYKTKARNTMSKVCDVVLTHEEKFPHCNCKLGWITELITGRDSKKCLPSLRTNILRQ